MSLFKFLSYFNLFVFVLAARRHCLNSGLPVFLGEDMTEFRCDCKPGYFGPFCEYQDTTKLGPRNVSGETTDGSESTFVNLLLCVFFLLILPTLVVYLIRTLYLFLKRCYYYQQPPSRRPNSNEMAETTEVTVQLPPYCRRQLHGTRSLSVMHQSASLSLHEFHELLVNLQREMQTSSGVGQTHIDLLDYRSRPDFLRTQIERSPRLEQPPSYESVVRTDTNLHRTSRTTSLRNL